MTEIKGKAKLKNLDIAPRKVRLVANSIRGMHVQQALAELEARGSRSGIQLAKLVRSAVANAKDNKTNADNLFIHSISVDEGIALKRALPKAQGRASLVMKKRSHISIGLAEKESKAKPSFAMPEKKKKARDLHVHDMERTRKPKREAERIEQAKKPGFAKRVFQRKSI